MTDWRVLEGDCVDVLRQLDVGSVQTCVTSPPYWGLRDYSAEGQLGLEPTPEQYVENLVAVFREVRRVLRDDGTVWLNLGDSYAGGGRGGHSEGLNGSPPQGQGNAYPRSYRGLKSKDLVGIPWRVAFALQADGWWLRSDIIWAKPNPMPESVTDRPTRSHEYIFLLTKSARYFYDADAIREVHTVPLNERRERLTAGERRPGDFARSFEAGNGVGDGNSRGFPEGGRNRRSVWTVTTQPFPGAHFATFPPKLIEPCVLAGSAGEDLVLDPFAGAGTTGIVALRHGREFVGVELNPEYAEMTRARIRAYEANPNGYLDATEPVPGQLELLGD